MCWHAYIFRNDHDLQHAFLWNNKCLFKWANLEAVIRLNREELLTPYSLLNEPIFSSFHSWVHYNVSMRMKSPLTTCFVRQKAKFLCLTKYWIMCSQIQWGHAGTFSVSFFFAAASLLIFPVIVDWFLILLTLLFLINQSANWKANNINLGFVRGTIFLKFFFVLAEANWTTIL